MKKQMGLWLIAAFLLAACGGGGGGGGGGEEGGGSDSAGGESASAGASAPVVKDLSGHYSLIEEDCDRIDFLGGTLTKTGQTVAEDGAQVDIYASSPDDSGFSPATDIQYHTRLDILADCLSPDVASDSCDVLCMGSFSDGNRLEMICDDGLSGNVCNVSFLKD